jgi:Uri superfamily endonuclease
VCFFQGDYLYLGSACGPGGLQARLRRHLLGSEKIHWHIDFLRRAAGVRVYWYLPSNVVCRDKIPLECLWSQALVELKGAWLPAPGFGASDCHAGCRSHLVAIPKDVDINLITQTLREAAGDIFGSSLVCKAYPESIFDEI